MKRFYGGIISGSTNVTGAGFLTAATVQLTPSSTTTMNATGGTISYSGNYKIHTFTTSGTFTVTSGVNVLVEYLAIGGGGGGANSAGSASNYGGGGGGGGFLEYIAGAVDGSDFVGYRVVVSAGDVLTITVGAGGGRGGNGGASKITSASRNYVVALGGGGGGSTTSYYAPHGGASGGGNWNSAREPSIVTYAGINYSPKQGWTINNKLYGCGAGWDGVSVNTPIMNARTSAITGGSYSAGAYTSTSAVAGAANTGNSGQGGNQSYNGGVGAAGGSGIVVLRYIYQ